MGRPPRNFEDGIYHVAAHASDTRYLFLSPDDRDDFLERLAASLWPLGIRVLDYVLMSNHYHALVHTPDARLSKGLQLLHTEYSRHHNQRYHRSAHLFRAHCVTRAVTSDEQLLTAYRYIARNPVLARLVLDPLEWPWSSARAHAGLERPSIQLDEEPIRDALGQTPNWRHEYRELIRREDDIELDRRSAAGVGSRAVLSRVVPSTE